VRHVGRIIVTSSTNQSRIAQGRAWLAARAPAEEILVLAANADAANGLVRDVALEKGACFGWHRLSLPQFAAVLAAPLLAERGIVPLSPLGVQAISARVVNRLAARSALGRYATIADSPGFARALAGVVTEFRSANLRPEALNGVAPDLLPMIEAYEAILGEDGFADWAKGNDHRRCTA
jgi:hypothetical protein